MGVQFLHGGDRRDLDGAVVKVRDVSGAAIATVISQLVSAVLCCVYIFFKVKMLLPNRNSFKNLTSTVRDELKVGFPMGLQNSVISIGMMVLQYFVNQFGSYAVAAYTIGNRVQLLIQNPMNSMSTVIATFAGQNEGAGRYDRIKKGVNFCLLICIVYSIVIGAVSMIFAQPITGIFTSGSSQQTIDYSVQFIFWNCPFECSLAMLFIYRGTIQGLKNGIVPMIGVALRNSAIATTRETNILQTLATLPEGLRDCSAVLAYLFSTVGCITIVAALAAVDLRITGSRRVVIRDVVVSVAPILYVTGVKWLVERPRPVTSAGSGLLPGDPSFPSGHTAAAVIVSVMMILTVRNFAHKCFPDGEDDGRANRRRVFLRRTIIGAVALVVAVACSRLLLGLHYPTDVIISATICPLISYAVWCVWNACESAGER